MSKGKRLYVSPAMRREDEFKRKEVKRMLDKLKNFDVDRMDVDELMEMSILAREMSAEYQHYGSKVPEWLVERGKSIAREIKARLSDTLEKELREKRSRLEQLIPASERREQLQREIAELEAKIQPV